MPLTGAPGVSAGRIEGGTRRANLPSSLRRPRSAAASSDRSAQLLIPVCCRCATGKRSNPIFPSSTLEAEDEFQTIAAYSSVIFRDRLIQEGKTRPRWRAGQPTGLVSFVRHTGHNSAKATTSPMLESRLNRRHAIAGGLSSKEATAGFAFASFSPDGLEPA